MSTKSIIYSTAAREKVKSGVDKVTNAVAVTLGPRGRHVLIGRPWGSPHVTRDGVTIAREIFLLDQYEDMGAQMIKLAAQKTVDDAGDGTTTATVLTQAIYSEGLKLLVADYNPMPLKRGIDKAVTAVVEELGNITKQTQDPADIEKVGTISANDSDIGKLLSQAMAKVGKDGVITIEESPSLQTFLEITEGMQFDRGYITPYFVTNVDKVQAELEECYVFIHDGRLENVKEIEPLLQAVSANGKPLLFIAEDYGKNFLTTLIINKQRGTLFSCPVKAPGFGERRKEILKDLAILTGGTVISDEAGISLKQVDLKHLGVARKVVVNRASTIIVGGAGTTETLKARMNQIKNDIENCDSEYDRKTMRERLAKLSGGVAVVKVGAPTEPELKEKKDRVEDAMHATRAAVEEGIVAGGGVALLRCQPTVSRLIESMTDKEEREGAKIIFNSLEAPVRTIVHNAGGKPDIVVERLSATTDNRGFGYNAATDTYEDLLASGIIDPKKVVRCALQNAASIASMLLTTEALLADDPDAGADNLPST